MLHVVTLIAFLLHITGGFIGLVSGSIAAFATKGGALHRGAGNIFVAAMLVMAVFAIHLAVVMPDQLVNVFIGVFATYLVVTAWLTVRRRPGAIGRAERAGFVVALLLSAPFVLLSVQLALGLTPFIRSAVPFRGPVLVAIFAFTAVLVIAALGDARTVLAGGIAGPPRIARHLWRMCLGLTLAFGSAFTNGFARLLPGPYHVPPAFFYPQFLPIILLAYWMIRVRFTGWERQRREGGE